VQFIELKQNDISFAYTLFDSSHLGSMTFNDFQRFFKLAWYFDYLDQNNIGVISNKDLVEKLSKYTSPLPLTLLEKQ